MHLCFIAITLLTHGASLCLASVTTDFKDLIHDKVVRNIDDQEIIQQEFLNEYQTPKNEPYFDTTIPTNVTGLVGKTAYLKCKVKNLTNQTVSWVRHNDLHLLTVGRYTYTSDQRYEAVHSPHTEDWSLRIKYPQKKDTGTYECQISTTPPIGRELYLEVVEPKTEILGGPEMFVDKGSTINLTCRVEFPPQTPNNLQWNHIGEPIGYDSPRGGISVVTVKGSITTSRLLIQKADEPDSGEYSCDPYVTKPAVVTVHILNGEHPAAMHHGHANMITSYNPLINVLILPAIIFLRTIQM